ncbi:MAG: hypothetical protein WEF50_22330 [Myxococcota bacterium]
MALNVVAISMSACERVSTDYATRAEADAEGAIEAGWMPEFVPTSARSIRETHDIDTSEVCLRFELPTEDHAEFVDSMRQLQPDEVEALSQTCRLQPRWWFEGLIQHQPANDAALNASFYETAVPRWNTSALVAVDRVGPSVYV